MKVCRTCFEDQGPLYRSNGIVVVVEKSLSKLRPCMRMQCADYRPKPVSPWRSRRPCRMTRPLFSRHFHKNSSYRKGCFLRSHFSKMIDKRVHRTTFDTDLTVQANPLDASAYDKTLELASFLHITNASTTCHWRSNESGLGSSGIHPIS